MIEVMQRVFIGVASVLGFGVAVSLPGIISVYLFSLNPIWGYVVLITGYYCYEIGDDYLKHKRGR